MPKRVTDAAARALQAGAAAMAALAVTALAMAATSSAVSAQTLIRDSEIERTIDMLVAPIFQAAEMPPTEIEIFIIQDRTLNAFVTPSRSMFLHTGLLQTLETPEELMGVLAHETGHITGGHIFRRIAAIEQARTQAILATLLGVAATAAGAGAGGAAIIGGGQSIAQRGLSKFTRGQESSADQAALTFLTRANVDPEGMLRVLERLAAQESVFGDSFDPYTRTHPLSRDRIQALAQGVAASPALGQPVSRELNYWHARMRAKLAGFLNDPGAVPTDTFGDRELDLYREAIRLFRLPDPDRAVTAMDELLSMRPDDPYYWELKGQILAESGRGPAAIEPYRRAVELAPGDALIAAGLGAALLTANTPEADAEALDVLERASLDDPFDANLRRPLANAYARAGEEGLADVVTAERLALTGRHRDAVRMAERAKSKLPVGSPGWRRAEDIIRLNPAN